MDLLQMTGRRRGWFQDSGRGGAWCDWSIVRWADMLSVGLQPGQGRGLWRDFRDVSSRKL